jgi:hypothetical protein
MMARTESIEKEGIITHLKQASTKWAVVASQAYKQDGEGENGPICLILHKARWVVFIYSRYR